MSRERLWDMAEISEVVKSALGEPATREIAERIERELAARGLYEAAKGGPPEPERCGMCGGLRRERDHERNSDRVCRCGGRRRRLLSYLDAADPERRMTLDALDASEPTVTAALEAACGIVSGERGGGCCSWGCQGEARPIS